MSKLREYITSTCEKKFVIKCLSEYKRLDGRAFDEFRSLEIEFGQDWGCCYVSLGKTKVLAQVTTEIQQPQPLRLNEGLLNINIELNPLSDPHFEVGRQTDLSVQLNRLIEKCLKDTKVLDLESLCLKLGEKVFAIRVDVNVLNHEGNILDCASIAILASLLHFRRPNISLEHNEHSDYKRDPVSLEINHFPICVTYCILNNGEYILADPSFLEENTADAFLTIGLNSYNELCTLHLGGMVELSPDIIQQTTKKALSRVTTIIRQINKEIEDDNSKRDIVKENDNIPYEIGFHNLIDNEKIDVDNLMKYLDQWTIKKSKNKKISQVPMKTGNVKQFDKNSAVFIPDEGKNQENWDIKDDNVDDVTIKKVQDVQTVTISSSDSEEENVVILNANKMTGKRRKK